MDKEQKKWQEQFSRNFGAREYLRFSCFFLIWMFLAIALGLIFYTSKLFSTLLITGFLIAVFAFAIFSRTWKPAYAFFRIILGNKNLPSEPMPRSTMKLRRQPLPWWGYLFGIWFLLLDLLILYIMLKR